MYRPEIKVLDCTIRDGGLINNWQFTDQFVQNVFTACEVSGIDYVEIGYKSSAGMFSKDVVGKWKFCHEEDLKKLIGKKKGKIKLSAMADIGRINYEDIPQAKDSALDMIRVACYVKEIDKAIDLVKHITDKGYETTINIMAVSQAKDPELNEALQQIGEECKTKAVYVVDSFGSMYSEQIHYLVDKYKKYLNPKGIEVGIHAHNNLQLGFANTIEAIIKGANFMDATINGIGRGAGNCPLELLLGFLKNPKFNIVPILKILQEDFLELRKEIEWGYIIPYVITGILNEHPRSAIKLRESADKDKYAEFYQSLIEDIKV
ncbi:MAG: aldolase catalytic domain-containing protein [Candidatus Margulisiibacteriota bacterium]|jgi:4-hydroxy 2-oxovalerate aldolase